MKSRRTGLLSALLMLPILLAACNGDSNPASSQSQNSSTSQPSTPSGSGSSTSTSDTSGTGTGTATPPDTDAAAPPALPCDAASDAGTACVAAHSVTRLLTKNYTGPLFQVQRASDKATQDVYAYTASTLPSGADNKLLGSANVNSVNTFCNNTTCTVSDIYDQIDLVAPLKGGAFGNVPATLKLNSDGTESLVVTTGAPGSTTSTMTVPVLNGFATITLPGTSGTLTVQVHTAPMLTTQSPTLALTIGNDLPALSGGQAALSYMTLGQGVQIPALGTVGGQAYRNRIGTVNQSIGDSEIAEYMVAGAQYGPASGCCGTYGNMEDSADPSTYAKGEIEGEMFGLAFSSGNAAVFGYCDGYTGVSPLSSGSCKGVNWPGVDAEAGVYLYGPQQPANANFVTVLSKYSPVTQSNLFAVKSGDASQSVLTPVFDQAPPEAYNFFNDAGHAFNGQWQGGLSLGEGGDGSAAPIQFFEGAVIAKSTSNATDDAIQASIANFYGPTTDKTAAACSANNLINSPLSLASSNAWTQANGATAAVATDISGTSTYAATLTNANGNSIANIDETIRVQGGQSYTFTDYVLATTNATVFPGGSVQTDGPNGAEVPWVLNTNTGAIVQGTWGSGKPTSLTAVKSGNWWKVTMTFTAPAGANNAQVFIDPPTSSAAGVRSQQAQGLAATHFCPSLSMPSMGT
ncbi:Alpha-L-arabinofuranosidase B, catalytic [Paraburkholderia fungorum]|uniref:Alpha-L-arabinofuranosidase B, catalytic n=2 Tax=Paraburkholderia fungorum TaxID=134537 RepID=A0A1H0ZR56_9BURK|nr:arabinofuranosidase catalytic domain-containing protein [Paraburkholderia fungorum]SDQ29985.1 Alpha-L-arabinofuranosidase B, catalytic [Paraburkholderia fungorum]